MANPLIKFFSKLNAAVYRMTDGRWMGKFVEVTVKGVTKPLRARRASAEEKHALWPRCVAAYPPYADYQKKTTRDIPVFVCESRPK